jgi:1,2-dihydroxy-3-keto-5-methylthiopentene dioxygenase
MSLLITWPDGDPSTVLRQTTDPTEIASALTQIGCRFERRPVHPEVAADAGQDAVLGAYRDIVDKLVADEGFVTVDIASIHPSDDPGWAETVKSARAKFIDEHTHGDDDELRLMTRGAGVFYVHIGDRVHAVYCAAGDLFGLPRSTTHWFDMGTRPDFTAIRFFHLRQGWVGIPTGSDISRRFPEFDTVHTHALALGAA